jgi:hypothetical protein
MPSILDALSLRLGGTEQVNCVGLVGEDVSRRSVQRSQRNQLGQPASGVRTAGVNLGATLIAEVALRLSSGLLRASTSGEGISLRSEEP